MILAQLIAALPLLINAIRAGLETWRLAEESGAPDQIVTSALTTLRQALAAGMRIRDAVQQLADTEEMVVPDLIELRALIDQVEALPDKDVEG